jgi:hypothetical protein
MKRYFLLAALLVLAASLQAETYRTVDKKGKVEYSDSQPDEDTDFRAIKVAKPPEVEDEIPYESRRARENFPVTFYSFKDCGAACENARALLTNRAIPFTEKSLEWKDEIDEFSKQSGNRDMPAMTVGKTWVKGYLESQWNRELDIAGYAKSSPYRTQKPSKTFETSKNSVAPKAPDMSKTIEAPQD